MDRLAWLGTLVIAPGLAMSLATWSGCGSSEDTNTTAATGTTSGPTPCQVAEDCPMALGVCLTNKQCNAGTCVYEFTPDGTPLPTDSVGDCEKSLCDGAGGIRKEPDPSDTKNDANQCTTESCEEGMPVSTPVAPGTMCTEDGGRFCHSDAVCRYCPEIGPSCEDTGNGEPNDDQTDAVDLGSVVSSDAGIASTCGVLKGAMDVDWYTYAGEFDGRTVDPKRDPHGADVEVCRYAECAMGMTAVTCGAGSTADVAPGGQSGCCGSGSFSILPMDGDLCPEADTDSATIWIKVTAGSSAACTPYQLDATY